MARLSAEQIKEVVLNFIPLSIQNNIFIKSLLAGATAVGVLLSIPAFAPAGVIGATGWIVVYAVTGGTFSYEAVSKAWKAWKNFSDQEREIADEKLKRMKKALDDGDISEEEYKKLAKELLEKIIK